MLSRESSQEVYRARVNQAVTFITENLSEPLDLERVAREASFSPFHFHRIFTGVLGETPQDFINRLRVERAANLLLKSAARSITEIALSCGFSSPATFARSFKKYFGMSASQYIAAYQGKSSIAEKVVISGANFPGSRLEPEDQGKLLVSIQTQILPSLNVAYIANMEGYSLTKICRAWKQLFLWASARGLISSSSKMLGISYDDPMITQASKCRYYACITLSEELPPDPLVGYLTIPGGQYAVCKMECSAEEIYMGYRTIYADWLPWSGFQPDDRPSYEVYLQTPETSPRGKFLMEICIPVVPLAG